MSLSFVLVIGGAAADVDIVVVVLAVAAVVC